MTLDEAIKHAIYESYDKKDCSCANEHRQLAEWLTELKLFKTANKAKDEHIAELTEKLEAENKWFDTSVKLAEENCLQKTKIAELEAKQEAIKAYCEEQNQKAINGIINGEWMEGCYSGREDAYQDILNKMEQEQ